MPAAGFPASCRSPGVSIPWSRALRMRCESLELCQNVSIDASLLPRRLESHHLVERARQIANHAGKCLRPVSQGAHPADDDLVVQSSGKILIAPGKAFEEFRLIDEVCQRTFSLPAYFLDQGQDAGRKWFRSSSGDFFERSDIVAEVYLGCSEVLKALHEGPQLPCLYQ